MRPPSQRGLTLTEVMIVVALAALVMLGLVSFYMTSQSVWMEGSTQALIQRDATLLVAAITGSVRHAARAEVLDHNGQQIVYLRADANPATPPFRCFYWDDSRAGTGRVYAGRDQPRGDDTLVVVSQVDSFRLSAVDTSLVLVDLVELPTPDGLPVRLRSAAALYNR